MKSRIVEQEQNKERKYPYIGISEIGNVVYFTDKETGISLVNKTSGFFLEECSGWIEDAFTPVAGKITIEFEV